MKGMSLPNETHPESHLAFKRLASTIPSDVETHRLLVRHDHASEPASLFRSWLRFDDF